MKQIARLFEYFKLAFNINRDNKGLYKPQIILILLKASLIIITAVVVYDYVGFFSIVENISEEIILSKLFSTFALFSGITIATLIANIVVEAGLYNMYKDCITRGSMELDSFSVGVKTNFIKFLLADLLLFIAWIFMFIPYFIIGFLTLFAGFIIVPIIISIFVVMWKVSMVMDGVSISDGFRNSVKFAKDNFWPLSFLIIIRNSFSSIMTGGGNYGGNNLSNFNSSNSDVKNNIASDKLGDVSGIFDGINTNTETMMSFIKIVLFILIPIVTIATIVSSLIKMIFNVFFSLSIFIMYSENANSKKIDLAKEVL